jgi:hypothetical protein
MWPQPVVDFAKKLVNLFRNTQHARDALRSVQKEAIDKGASLFKGELAMDDFDQADLDAVETNVGPPLTLVQDVITRWYSTYLSIGRIVRLRPHISLALQRLCGNAQLEHRRQEFAAATEGFRQHRRDFMVLEAVSCLLQSSLSTV